MIGIILVLLSLAIVIVVAKAIAMRFAADPFCVLCATAYMPLLFASFIFDRARTGNEFGPLAEIVFFYSIGLAFWVAGLVVLWRAFSRGEPLGYFRTTLQCVSGLWYLGPALAIGWLLVFPSPNYGYDLIVETRAPKTLQFDPLTRILFHTDTDRTENALGWVKKRTEGEFTVFSDSFGIRDWVDRRILAVQPPNEPFQVFRPPIPKELHAQDWSPWRRPDYLVKAKDDWRPLEDTSKHPRTPNLPADCFQLRYRIERHELEKWKPPKQAGRR
jgi:hypothetical protein